MINHDNIVKIIDFKDKNNEQQILMEYAGNCNLLKFMLLNDKICDYKILTIMKKMAEILLYLK